MKMTEPEFEATVSEALAGVPERFKKALSNIAITVADEPSPQELQDACIGANGELLGLYQGIPLTQRTTGYAGVLPDRITIFKGPHERVCSTHADMVEQIRKTVLHELGHYFGFDDAYLHSHGY
ncbi:metallopeptidase family protein [Bifidobacterium choloepi]|uniref:Metallopeptidase family protein n=1 Tax=Bifidobacterium choloepi TaxID=2614131 RepID=A0A6I5N0U7_9BIFI|nr:metallopeptidase family protein [Bifidobacterium choloepi]NEG70207.1 metallopeptidase family protein [Bifidobacterium choloepi]